MDERFLSLSVKARVLFLGTTMLADENMVTRCGCRWLKARVFPGDDISLHEMGLLVDEITENQLADVFFSDHDGEVDRAFMHLSIKSNRRNKPSQFPKPPEWAELSGGEVTSDLAIMSRSDAKAKGCDGKLIVSLKNPSLVFVCQQSDISLWKERYQSVDVMYTLRAIAAWNEDNKEKRKTHRGIRKHITGWLSRENKKARKPYGGNMQAATARGQVVASKKVVPINRGAYKPEDVMDAFDSAETEKKARN